MGKMTLDPKSPPSLTAHEIKRFDAMTPEEIELNALEDPDNPPFTQDELERALTARLVRDTRKARGMSQTVFAQTYSIAVSRLRDWEQGRFRPDPMAQAYLSIIRFEPDAVARAMRRYNNMSSTTAEQNPES